MDARTTTRALAGDIPPERCVRLGMLTPSSNTVLVSLHFGRFRVTEISLSSHHGDSGLHGRRTQQGAAYEGDHGSQHCRLESK